MILLMMLMPWAKETRYQGHAACVLRIRICTRAMTTRNVSSTGSHHSCDLTEYDDGGKDEERDDLEAHDAQGSFPAC